MTSSIYLRNKRLELGFSMQDVKVLKRETSYAGYLRVDQLKISIRHFEGGWSRPFQREVLMRPSGVGVLLHDPVTDQLLLVEQFRVGCLEDESNGPWTLELVAGMVDKDLSPEDIARLECQEEAGLFINELTYMLNYYNSPGCSAEKLSIYYATFDALTYQEGIHGVETENENIRTLLVPRATAMAALSVGRINNAMTIIALQWLALKLSKTCNTL
jgi:ADP-ribose pyrophosphatase